MDTNNNLPSEPIPVIKGPSRFHKLLRRFLILSFSLIVLIIILGFVIGIFYGNEVKSYVIEQLNKQLNTKVVIDPQNINFSVLKNFPSASVEFKQVLALDALPKDPKDTLFSAGSISMQFNIMDVFHKKYKIRKLVLADVVVKVKIDKYGKDNYHFWKPSADSSSGSGNFSFALEKIYLKNISFHYLDKQSRQSDWLKVDKGTLSGRFTDDEYDLSTDLKLFVDHITSDSTIYLSSKPAEVKADFSINNKTHTYGVKIGSMKLADLKFDVNGSVMYKDSSSVVDLKLNGSDLDIRSVLSLLPEKYKDKINDYSSDGNFYFDATIKGKYNRFETPLVVSRFGIENGTIRHTRSDLNFKQVELSGTYTNKNNSKLVVSKFSGKLNEGVLSGHFSIENFNDPYLDLNINADMDLSNLQKFMQVDTIESLAGRAKTDLTYKGKFPQGKDGKTIIGRDLKNATTSGNLELSNVSIRFKNSKQVYDSINGTFLFDNSDIAVNDFRGQVSGSDFDFKGFFRNILPYIFLDDEDLTVEARLKCNKLDLNQLLVDDDKTTKHDTVYELKFSEYIHLDLNSHIKELVFRHFEATDLKGHIALEDKKMVIDPVSFNTMDGKISGGVVVDGHRSKQIGISCNASLKKVDINKLFVELENFGQSTFTDKNIKGLLTSDIQYSSVWSSTLQADLKKVYATADITIEKGEILNFEPLKAFSKFINVKELSDIKFATLENQIKIKDGTIFIPQMDLKNSALNLSCSGKHTFNNEIDYHFRLLMRELLAKKAREAKKENEEFGEVEDDGLSRTLFISMSGTVDEPIIHYDKKGMFKKIKEDIKKEKENLKGILHEEFGWFKKDSTLTKVKKKEEDKRKDGKFKVKWNEDEKDDKKKDEDF